MTHKEHPSTAHIFYTIFCNVRITTVQSVSRTPRVQLHPLAATRSGFPAGSPSTVLAMASLPVRSIAINIHVFQTVRKYGPSPITTCSPSELTQKLLENLQLLPLKLHACLMQFELHKHVRLVSLKPQTSYQFVGYDTLGIGK
jgi:hypothetical protein